MGMVACQLPRHGAPCGIADLGLFTPRGSRDPEWLARQGFGEDAVQAAVALGWPIREMRTAWSPRTAHLASCNALLQANAMAREVQYVGNVFLTATERRGVVLGVDKDLRHIHGRCPLWAIL